MRRTLYIVGILKERLTMSSVEHQNIVMHAPCVWAEGMCGAFPAFWERKYAEAYQAKLGARYPIEEFEVDIPGDMLQ
jgi:hypothetical protein